MLVAIKSGMMGSTEVWPGHGFELGSDRLNPAFSWSREVHARALDPHKRINRVYLEVVFGTRDPQAKISGIKGWESHLRELAGGIVV